MGFEERFLKTKMGDSRRDSIEVDTSVFGF